MNETFEQHAPWKLVHAVIAGLIVVKSLVWTALFLTLGVVVTE